jgi:stearoyl-CoA desaturase (delta-9 desaturase)
MSAAAPSPEDRFDLRACVPLLGVHALCAAAFVTGVTATALAVCVALVFVRLFGLTAGYHRGLAHGAYRSGRATRFALAWLGASAGQLGPLWWAAQHRLHHRHADVEGDPHSPRVRGLFWAQIGWLLRRRSARTPVETIPDLLQIPELVWLERFHWLAPTSLAAALYTAGAVLANRAPELGVTGAQLLVWGFCVSTVLLFHLSLAVASLGHRYGERPYALADDSGNLPWLAWLTLGDGWHNNHHAHPGWARHGHAPSELDLTWLGLCALRALGLVWDLRGPETAATPRRLPRHPHADPDARHA